jgi:glutamine amidotransferase
MGNCASILNMLRKIGLEAQISLSTSDINASKAYILPGVGAFDNCIQKMKKSGMLDLLEDMVINREKPFLGICLGMQMLFESSEEGNESGLGWLNGVVKRFDTSKMEPSKKVPHMGWNFVKSSGDNQLFNELHDQNRFYFVHSFHATCSDPSDELAVAHHGYDFTCGVQRKNIVGVQFHPEKSHRFGMLFFKNFSKLITC